MKGLDLSEYERRFEKDLIEEYAEDLENLKESDLVKFDKNILHLTLKGRLYSNEVFAVFV